MILGVDLGNFATKTSEMVHFVSKCTKASLLANNPFIVESETYFIGEGSRNTEYRKVKKAHLKIFFLYAVAKSTTDVNNKVVVGLPISQYREDKDELKNLLLTGKSTNIVIDGKERKINVEDIKVYPEGLVDAEDGVKIDIGGRTTEIAYIQDEEIIFSISIPVGTLNLYADFVNAINSRYGLDLRPNDAARILYNGLVIDGSFTDFSFALDVFKDFVDDLVSQIQVKCPLKTLPVAILGGGGQLLYHSIKERIPNCYLVENPVFANALLFKEVGELEWL